MNVSMSMPVTGAEARHGAVIDLRGQHRDEAALVEVAILDSQEVFRRGVRSALSDDPAIALVAESASWQPLEASLGTRSPSVFLCDIALTEGGESVSGRIRERFPDSHVVVVVSAEDDVELARAVRGGARGYLRRDCTLAELRATVLAAARGQSILAPSVASKLLEELATMVKRSEHGAEGVGALSKREREVLSLVAEGLNNRAIAARLFISENTVKNHVRNIHEKLGVHTRMEAVVRAVREGLLRIA